MFMRRRVPMIYSRAELVADAAVHAIGLVAALVAVPVLFSLAVVWFGETWMVLAAAVYGMSLIGMFVCSALYNMLRAAAWKDLLPRSTSRRST